MQSYFVDSCVWIASLFPGHREHARAKSLLKNDGKQYTSNFVIDEVVAFILGSAQLPDDPGKRRAEALRFMKFAEDTQKVAALAVTGGHFGEAKSFAENIPLNLTITDWTSLILMKENRIKTLLSFDREFKNARNIPNLGFFRVMP
jgi:predicted nucleic acid-binding protein